MNTWLPSFTGMDFSLPTNVDGRQLQCVLRRQLHQLLCGKGTTVSYAQIAEVVYYEYGHGINDNYYQDNGSFFVNGAMNEGYADISALSITGIRCWRKAARSAIRTITSGVTIRSHSVSAAGPGGAGPRGRGRSSVGPGGTTTC